MFSKNECLTFFFFFQVSLVGTKSTSQFGHTFLFKLGPQLLEGPHHHSDSVLLTYSYCSAGLLHIYIISITFKPLPNEFTQC